MIQETHFSLKDTQRLSMTGQGKIISSEAQANQTKGTCVLSHFSPVRLFVTLWTVPHQAPLSMGFSRQEYWSGLPGPPPGGLPDPGIEPSFLMSPALAGGFFTISASWESPKTIDWC